MPILSQGSDSTMNVSLFRRCSSFACKHSQIRAKRAKSNEFEIPFDRQALADFLCVDRSALSTELSKLRRERKVESGKNRFKLLGS